MSTRSEAQRAQGRKPVVHRPGQDHVFYAHEDPRWLVCDCGQLAQRTRTPDGQYAVRLIGGPESTLSTRPGFETSEHGA